MNQSQYILAVGEGASLRLMIQHRLFEAASCDFLKRVGLKSGMRVMDMGCGTGLMTCELSRIVGAEGQVDALDQSCEQLGIAAKYHTNENTHYSEVDVTQIPHDLRGQYDFIYCRYFFGHLQDPAGALKSLIECLKLCGIIACEGLQHDSAYAFPTSDAIESFKEIVMSLLAKVGLKDCGHRLYGMFQDAGLVDIGATQIQPVLITSEERSLYRLVFDELEETLIEKEILSKVLSTF